MHPSLRLAAGIAVAAIVALVLIAAAVVAGPVSADELQLEDCRIDAGPGFPGIKARCGEMTRPLNPGEPGDPSSGEILLRIAVVPALSLTPEPDAFLPVAGGPGQSSIEFYASIAPAFDRVRRDRDILLIDQRGTGDSAPLDCEVDDEIVAGQYDEKQTLALIRDCLERLPHDPRYFTTSVAVTDIDAVREALGYTQLNVYGVSYGSRVAQHYARRYPERTRSIVIDGVVPPQIPLGPDIALRSQTALERVFAACAGDEACAAAFPALGNEFADLQSRLRDESIEVQLASPLTGEPMTTEFGYDQFAIGIRLLLYHPNTIALLPLLIHEAANGNAAPLAAQALQVADDLGTTLAVGMHNAVMCTEDAPFYDEAAIDRDALERSYMGVQQIDALRSICSVWPAGVLDPDLREPLATDLPVLLLSGEADPITPPAYAELAAVGLRNARLRTVPGQGHGMAPVGCVPMLLGEFVSAADPDAAADACVEKAFAMPFFTSFSGPAP